MAPLALVSNSTRRVTGSGADRPLTPKGHVVVPHGPWFVDEDGICGVFGEDGCEALRVLDSLCRKMVRQMRNPEARRRNAHTLHHTSAERLKRFITSALWPSARIPSLRLEPRPHSKT
jgi:hypothetical protein